MQLAIGCLILYRLQLQHALRYSLLNSSKIVVSKMMRAKFDNFQAILRVSMPCCCF